MKVYSFSSEFAPSLTLLRLTFEEQASIVKIGLRVEPRRLCPAKPSSHNNKIYILEKASTMLGRVSDVLHTAADLVSLHIYRTSNKCHSSVFTYYVSFGLQIFPYIICCRVSRVNVVK